MGYAADDMFDAFLKEQAERDHLIELCPKAYAHPRPARLPCDWEYNNDGLLECKVCRQVTDDV